MLGFKFNHVRQRGHRSTRTKNYPEMQNVCFAITSLGNPDQIPNFTQWLLNKMMASHLHISNMITSLSNCLFWENPIFVLTLDSRQSNFCDPECHVQRILVLFMVKCHLGQPITGCKPSFANMLVITLQRLLQNCSTSRKKNTNTDHYLHSYIGPN